MKRLLNIAFGYAIASLSAGVFYREFTKYMDFTGRTTLAFMHPHLFVLGTIVFMVLAALSVSSDLERQNLFKPFLWLYNLGLVWTTCMFGLRGILQTRDVVLSRGAEAGMAGIAGIGHLLLGTGIIFAFLCLKRLKPVMEKTS